MFTHPDYHYRAGGIVVCRNHILLCRSEHEEYWSLPGGRMRLNEQAIAALQRELHLQTGIRPVVGRLIWVVNAYFQAQGDLQHEVGLYHLVQFPCESAIYHIEESFVSQEENGTPLRFQWFPRQADLLERLPLTPKFLSRAVEKLPANPEYIVFRDSSAKIAL